MSALFEGGADLIDIMGGGLPDESAKQWLGERAAQIRDTLTGTGQEFFNRARSLYNIVSESQAVQILRNIRSKSENVWSSNQILPLRSLEAIQTAGPIMQRWVMACPDVRERYLNQTLDGYSDTYVNYHNDLVGLAHFDYRRVMDGVVVVEEDKDYVFREFIDYMEEDEHYLTVPERIDILNTWDYVKHYLEDGDEDPTSLYGAQL